MPNEPARRLPDVKTLYEILPKGAEGGKEFSRVVDLLIFHEARRSGKRVSLFSDAAGDYRGLDSFVGDAFRQSGSTGYQYKFYSSPLSSEHRKSIERSLGEAFENREELKLKKWILVTPHDLLESSTKKGGGDVSWFERLRGKFVTQFDVEHWGHKQLLALFLETPSICLYYYPELVQSGQNRRHTIEETRSKYDNSLVALYRDIQFVGMSVYKQEATRGVAIQDIYIPLALVSEQIDHADPQSPRESPNVLLVPGAQHIILGDPGSGKSTLLRFLALAGRSKALQERYQARSDSRLPVLVTLRKYADELKSAPNLGLLDYILQNIQADFSLRAADFYFFEYYLESGQTILLFDGLDELPNPQFKQIVRDRIRTLLLTYPGNSVVVTSRVVGYEEPFRFAADEFQHYRISALRLPEIEKFVRDWYRVRIENKAERDRNINDLLRILRDENHIAIRELASNPLLLTIVALVHRIDAVLPDERVVLYQKCTETLMNTWHTWKYREIEQKNRGKTERRNRARMEAIAYWMQCRSEATSKSATAIVSSEELHKFLTAYIIKEEKSVEGESDPQDLAADFLEFVRKRAGLLVEAGDGQYSFVHLTFQEYLTATHIITVNEPVGTNGIWDTIAGRVANPRWHEVIRLLIGGLRSPTSQGALLDRLLAGVSDVLSIHLSELLGGILLDGVEPAENRSGEIIRQLLLSAARSETVEECTRLVRMLRGIREKGSENEVQIKGTIRDATEDREIKRRLSLLAPSLNMENRESLDLYGEVSSSVADKLCFELLFGDGGPQVPMGPLKARLLKLFAIQDLWMISAGNTNYAAALLQGVVCAFEYGQAANRLFHQQLTSLIGGCSGGPFKEFTGNVLEWIQVRKARLDIGRARNLFRAYKSRETVGLVGTKDNREQPLNGDLEEIWNSVRGRDAGLWEGRHILRSRLSAIPKLKNLIESMDAFESHSPGGSTLKERESGLLLSTATSFAMQTVSQCLELQPGAQWLASLNHTYIQSLGSRIWVLDPQVWNSLELRLREGQQNEGDFFFCAWLLLFDVWLYICDYHSSASESELDFVAGMTRSITHPAMRIAHAIRDRAYGKKPLEPLLSLVNDPSCRESFFRAGWIRGETNQRGFLGRALS